ncbi:nectin-3 isoform X39 [Canis lupus familiaris]|uniref:nectin-3 isoform X39 n=1 Tax=Canis lupus familiaris TaxID=9615 RepID=UPI000DC6C7F1|nr:nectin-3 isoform X39 [Canis lupus familiaris]XP_038438695.1 nectin-3 isoform X27 [Canis lupus familiaris]
MARTPGPAPLCPAGGKAQLSSASPPGAGLPLPPPTPPPPLLLLLFPLLLFSRLCGALAGPIIVEPHVTAVWGKNVSLKCLIEVNETITQISWEKIHGKSSQTVAVHHPQYGFSVQGEYQGRVLFKNYSLNDATITLHNIGFSDSGKYICKAVTFPLGNAQSSTTVTVLVEPTVSLIKGPDSLIDGGNETVAAICIAATGKPVAHIDWEGDLGEMESTTTSFPNETATIVSQYKVFPTRFARGRRITCVVKHPALEKDIRYSFILDIQYAPEVSVTGYDGNWFVGRKGVNLKCNADANPPPFKSVWSRLDGQWPDGLLASDNTLHFVYPLTFNYSGVYVCKVTNSLGQRSDQKVIYISDVPFKQTSSIAVAGAVIGAVLALFIIAVFVTVLLTPRKKRPSYLDKVIDLPPTHKPPPMYEERSPPLLQKDLLYQNCHGYQENILNTCLCRLSSKKERLAVSSTLYVLHSSLASLKVIHYGWSQLLPNSELVIRTDETCKWCSVHLVDG